MINTIDALTQMHGKLNENYDKEGKEKFIVVFANACTNPRAMMIKSLDTNVAVIAVRSSWWTVYVAFTTIF